MQKVKQLIFDADDTLWENNKLFIDTTESFFDICEEAGYKRSIVENAFAEFEIIAVKEKGYGSETFIYILDYLFSHFNSNNKLNKNKYDDLRTKFISHIQNDPLLFPGVSQVLNSLNQRYDLYVLTKGNINEQKEKLNRSGLKKFFKKEFVVTEKNDNTFLTILKDNNWKANECCMIGNSPKSDINPALRCGMYAIFIPYAFTWHLDNEELMDNHQKFYEVKNFKQIPDLLNGLFKT